MKELKILIVENIDYKQNLWIKTFQIISKIHKLKIGAIHTAKNGVEVENYIESNVYDLAILDIQLDMPLEKDGIYLAHLLRNKEKSQLIYLTTAYRKGQYEEQVQNLLKSGIINGFIHKADGGVPTLKKEIEDIKNLLME
ncbi:response regulator [Aureisphaera galaxeae]|uniref:response regulator n=1 Tax=Aureisphaera galaxeae TaxID=1538023 RepID=UPI002350505B|nr:response regulator [Aureisphaera galaxeae]MDC8002837.1 response regulator [Aureisphaera galaxeae]